MISLSTFWRDLNDRQKIALVVLLAILLRLLLMPFFMHMDLLSEYRRVNYAVDNGVVFPGLNRIVTFWIECFFYWFTQLFVVGKELLLYLPNPEHSTSSPTRHFVFVGDPYVFRHIFLFKLPYLVFDLLAARLVWHYFAKSQWQFLATVFWLFNPVTLYASYLFGRFEVISLFFLIATAVSLKQQRLVLAALCFGLALNCREINILFAPAFLLSVWFFNREFKPKFSTLVTALLLVTLLWRFPHLMQSLFGLSSPFTSPSSLIDVDRGVAALLNHQFAGVYPFFLIAGAGLLLLIVRDQMEPAHAFVAACLISIAAFFSSGFQSAHYFAWIVPFLILAIHQARAVLIPSLALVTAWIAYWLLNPEGAYFTPLLATPLDESFFGFGNLSQVYQSYFANHPLLDVGIVRDIIFSGSVACLLVLIALILRQPDRVNNAR